MKPFVTALAGAALMFSGPCWAEDTEAPMKSLQLSKAIVDTTGEPLKGKLRGGTLCAFPSKWKLGEGSKKTQNYERYDNLFAEALRAKGFPLSPFLAKCLQSNRTRTARIS